MVQGEIVVGVRIVWKWWFKPLVVVAILTHSERLKSFAINHGFVATVDV